jgi:dihydrofolate reductase
MGDETRAFITQTCQRADTFLFGQQTCELFAGSWGAIGEMRAHSIGVALTQTPQYVASTTLTAPRWADTAVLSGDLAAAIGELKAKRAGEVQLHGSGALIRWLLENDLVEEMTLLIVPVVLGRGDGRNQAVPIRGRCPATTDLPTWRDRVRRIAGSG